MLCYESLTVKDLFSIEKNAPWTNSKIPLECPITTKRITIPVRGGECNHVQVGAT